MHVPRHTHCELLQCPPPGLAPAANLITSPSLPRCSQLVAGATAGPREFATSVLKRLGKEGTQVTAVSARQDVAWVPGDSPGQAATPEHSPSLRVIGPASGAEARSGTKDKEL